MRYLVLSILIAGILTFAGITAIPTSVSIEEGGVVPIKLSLTDKDGNPTSGVVTADLDAGGFEELDLIVGMNVNKEATVHYIAPMIDGEYHLSFISGEDVATTVVNVVPQEITGEEATAQVIKFRGSVAYKTPDSEIWNPVREGLVLKEGYSILTVGNSYAIIEFPNKSQTKVLRNTQLRIEKLVKVESGYAIILKQYKGKTFSTVKKLLSSGEKFMIKTDSVTAGVRGTKFAVIEGENGFEIDTFEGEVFAYFNDGRVVPVPSGKSIKPGGKLEPIRHGIEEFYPEEKEGEVKKPEMKETEMRERRKEEPGSTGGRGFGVGAKSMYLGTVSKDDTNYLVYSFGVNLNLGIVGFDLGITAYSTEVGGTLYYGIPSTDPSTNLIDAITLNALRLNIGGFGLRYGSGGSYTLGMGYTMRRYTIPYGNTLDLSYSFGNFWMSVHLPYELRKISSFEFGQSDPVYYGEIGVNLRGIKTSLDIIYDSSAATSEIVSIEPVKYAGVLSAKRNLIGSFSLGAEVSGLYGTDGDIAWGGFAGLYGRLLILDFVAGPYVNGPGFTPLLFSMGYDSKRCGIDETRGMNMGYMAGVEFKESWGEGRIYLNGSFDSLEPILDGYLKGILPRFASFPSLEVSGYIHDPTPFQGVLDTDTTAWLSVATVIGGGMKTGTRFIWDGKEWKSEIFVTGVSM